MTLTVFFFFFFFLVSHGPDCSGPVVRGRGSLRRPADIPPIDPSVLLDLHKHTQEVAHSVEMMLRSLNGTIQNVSILTHVPHTCIFSFKKLTLCCHAEVHNLLYL